MKCTPASLLLFLRLERLFPRLFHPSTVFPVPSPPSSTQWFGASWTKSACPARTHIVGENKRDRRKRRAKKIEDRRQACAVAARVWSRFVAGLGAYAALRA